MAKLYLITYDLMTPGKDYDALIRALREIGAERRLYSVWLVRYAGVAPIDLAEYCLRFMDANDRIFVTEVPDDFSYRSLMAA